MVRALRKSSAHAPEYQWVLQPHRSLTWREARYVYAGFAAICLAIGAGFYEVGLTLILPFSGLEVLALGGAFYVCLNRGEMREVISVYGQTVVVERGKYCPEVRHEMQRAWLRVVLERQAIAWYPTRLKLRSHGREVELGAFLSDDERKEFACELARILRQCNDYKALQ